MKEPQASTVRSDYLAPALRTHGRGGLVGIHVVGAIAAMISAAPLHCSATPPSAPVGMKWIPPGEFVMGTDDENSLPNERPAHRVRLDGYWIDETPVTNAQFRKFVEATGYLTTAERPVDWEELKKQVPPGTPKPPDEMLKPGSLVFTPPDHRIDLRDLSQWWAWTIGASWKHPEGPRSSIDGKDDYPVVQVSWNDAAEYAKWAQKRLPTEAEWEFAARGGSAANTRFIWGDQFRPGGEGADSGKWMANTFTGEFPFKNTAEDGCAGTSPVRAFSVNGYGLYDMAGNVWQWTADLYRIDAHALATRELQKTGASCCINPKGPAESLNPTREVVGSPERVIKGGSFLCHVSYCESYRPTARRGTPPDTGSSHVGFRCVKDIDPAAPGPRQDQSGPSSTPK
jgi:formylglycine-generating enzyme